MWALFNPVTGSDCQVNHFYVWQGELASVNFSEFTSNVGVHHRQTECFPHLRQGQLWDDPQERAQASTLICIALQSWRTYSDVRTRIRQAGFKGPVSSTSPWSSASYSAGLVDSSITYEKDGKCQIPSLWQNGTQRQLDAVLSSDLVWLTFGCTYVDKLTRVFAVIEAATSL